MPPSSKRGLELGGQVQDASVAKEYVRDIYLTDDPALAGAALDTAPAWVHRPRRRTRAPNHRQDTPALAQRDPRPLRDGRINGKVEAAN